MEPEPLDQLVVVHIRDFRAELVPHLAHALSEHNRMPLSWAYSSTVSFIALLASPFKWAFKNQAGMAILTGNLVAPIFDDCAKAELYPEPQRGPRC
jgi:hypothetical protein